MKLTTYDPGIKKVIIAGLWDKAKNIIVREVQPQHFMRVLQGYGIQDVAFQEIVKAKIGHIVLREVQTGDELISTPATWIEHGQVKDYGRGKQRFLSINYMERRRKHDST